jgi:hypothetical protein
VAQVRAALVERMVATNCSEEAERLRNQVKGLDLVSDDSFKRPALARAGEVTNKPEPVEHYMALDSADERQLRQRETGSAH